MATIFSENQLKVINSRNKNLLVSAAAGAGKTAVLVERILKKATDRENPVDIDKILVVTFTKAAAGEMKERIRQALEKELAEHPEDSNLQRQATLIHNAQISTIDGFCLNIVRNNFHSIGLDPSFRIANDGEIGLIKKDVLKQVLDEAYEEGDKDFYGLVDRYTAKDKDNVIESSIMNIYNIAMSCPWPEKWLKDCVEDYKYKDFDDFRHSEFIKKVSVQVGDKLNEALAGLEVALDIAMLPNGPVNYCATIEEEINALEELSQKAVSGDWAALKIGFETLPAKRIPGKSGGDAELADKAKKARTAAKDILKSISSNYFAKSEEEYYEEIIQSGKSVETLVKLVLRFKEKFDKAKRERDIIDFSDMSHMAISILIKDYVDMDHYEITDIAREYRDYFEEVMTDEYQDSNQVQEIILSAISKEKGENAGNRFMVGDIKQSIYRFRLARPEIFNGKQKLYDADGITSEVIRLKDNYRSRSEVVNSVNAVFTSVMHSELGGVEYNENERLYAKADYPETDEKYTAQIILEERNDKSAEAGRESQARTLAALIKEIHGKKKIYDKGKKEIVTADYGDIAILFRSLKEWKPAIKKAFDEAGIPYHMEGTGTFYSAKEISTVLNLLRVIDNPLNDVPLFGTMISYFGGMSEEEAAVIQAEYREAGDYLWERLRSLGEEQPESKAANLVNLIEKYRRKVTYTTIGELISEIVTSTGYLDYVTALADGKQREANIELLIKKASDYAKTSFSGLFHFLRYVELIKKNEEDEGEANIFDENSATVRVMSIHKSKGLEFPVCIVGDLDSSFKTKDASAPFIADVDEGIATSYIDPEKRIKRKTLKQNYIAEKLISDNVGEEIRIFYVAMTRAREQLIMCGIVKDAENYFDETMPEKINSYLAILKKMHADGAGRDCFEYITTSEEERISSEISGVLNRKLLRNNLESGEVSEEVISLADEIKDRITTAYSHKNLEKLYTKTSVSELKMAAMEDIQGETKKKFEDREKSEYVPLFAGGGTETSGTDRGSAYHKLLQLIDFTKEYSEEEWKKQFAHMLELDFMEEDEQKLVPQNKIFTFGRSDLAMRMHNAALRGELYKEQPFVMGVPANRLEEDLPEEEIILVQGVIDVFFIEGGKVIVMDYKTDRVDNAAELVDRYRAQLNIYAEALEKITDKPVTEKVLYSFGLNETIVIE